MSVSEPIWTNHFRETNWQRQQSICRDNNNKIENNIQYAKNVMMSKMATLQQWTHPQQQQ